MSKSSELKVVLAGCGSMSRAWLRAAAGIKGVKVVGLVDVRHEAAEARAGEFGLEHADVGVDVRDVLRRTAPDIVFDCTVPEAHFYVVMAALRAGCHVLGEKPLADSMERARRMARAARAAGRLYAVMQNRRYAAPIRSLRAFLDSGAIGGITTVNCDFYIGAHFGGFRDRMRHVLLLDMAIHTFDMARFITRADPVKVCAREWNPAGSWYDHDASALAWFEMTGGVMFNYRGSWCAEGLNTTWECDWRIIGEKGSVKWDGATGFQAQAVAGAAGFWSKMRDVKVPLKKFKGFNAGHPDLIRDFVECVRSSREPETVCGDNIKSLAMVFGAIESSKKRAWIRTPAAD